MFAQIVDLEEKFNALFPTKRQTDYTPKELIEAGAKWATAVWQEATRLGALAFTEEKIGNALLLVENAVFVCGTERSGTTLLRNLLDAHPSLSVLPSEGTYITSLEKKILDLPVDARAAFLCKEWLWRLAMSMHQPPFWLLGRSTAAASPYVDFARAFITWWSIIEKELGNTNSMWPFVVLQVAFADSQKKLDEKQQLYWVEKTPMNEIHLTRLWEVFPKAKIIHVVRNPVDVFVSRKRMEAFTNTPPINFIRDLKKSLTIATEQLQRKDSRYLNIRYEDLCKDAALVTQNIATFLDIPYSDSLLTPTVAGRLANPNSSFKQTDALGKIMASNEHNQEDNITPKDFELLSANIGNLAIAFGYPLATVGLVRRKLLGLTTFQEGFTRRLRNRIKLFRKKN